MSKKKPYASVMFIMWLAFGALVCYIIGVTLGYWWMQGAYPDQWYFFTK